MQHITKILYEKGYKTYRYGCIFLNQNSSSKQQYKSIINRNDLIFVKGNKTTSTSCFYYPFGSILNINGFSTAVVGGIDIRFVKDEDLENQIIWGLSQYGKPPTIIYPRPKINVKKHREFNGTKIMFIENESMDDSMNLLLEKVNHEKIFKAMFDKSIIFNFDLTT